MKCNNGWHQAIYFDNNLKSLKVKIVWDSSSCEAVWSTHCKKKCKNTKGNEKKFWFKRFKAWLWRKVPFFQIITFQRYAEKEEKTV